MTRHEPVAAETVPESQPKTHYPSPFAACVAGRIKRKLGEVFGLTNFGVNLTQLAPGSMSALYHSHARQDEFIFVLSGNPTLIWADRERVLAPGDCMGFPAGTGQAHHLVNRSDEMVTYLEIGDRTAGDRVDYPHDDLAVTVGDDGRYRFSHKDGRPY